MPASCPNTTRFASSVTTGASLTCFASPQARCVAGRLRMPVTSFLPTSRGRSIADAPLLDSTRVRQLGLMIADGLAGPFRLEIRSIELLP
jgi:hypothetical protein